jgi:hypothetical protein
MGEEGTTELTQQTTEPGKWIAQLPDDLKGNEELKKYQTLKDFANAHLQTISGMKGMIRLPGKDAKPEDIQSFKKAIGVPEKPDAYTFEPMNLPEGVSLDDNLVTWFKDLAHKAGLSTEQAKQIYGEYVKRTVDTVVAHNKELSDGKVKLEADMKKEWGDNYNEKIALARKVVFEVAPEGFAKFLEDTKLGNHPLMTKFCAKVGDMMSEDKLGGTKGDQTQKVEIKKEIIYDKSPELYSK